MNRKGNWSVEEQASFLKRTGELLARGYPLAEAIDSLSYHLDRKKQKEIRSCIAELKEGYPFFQVLSDLQFNKHLVNYVYFAEQHGGLAEAVIEGSTMVLKREHDYDRLKKLISYPFFLIVLTSILFYFVDQVLLPKFTSLYENMNVETNIFATIISAFSTYVPLAFYFFVIFCLFVAGYYQFIFKNTPVLEQRRKLVSLPIIGKFLKLLYSQNFSVQLSYLFSSGMSIMEALNVFENNKQEPFSMSVGKEIKTILAAGSEFEYAIASFPFFEAELSRIIKHGQENGKLDQELFFYSRHCLAQLEEWTERGMRIVQPVLYSVIGLLIVALYLAILLPMFELLQGI
ncbi:competence type IV pilus assembly protein ComGB [Bacillus sp. B15-48]|uniref:competence type IV pilus assembly protein ComGB n=1 Tax=Bacillus sp. B15-48 TaxID=1548601 RepID=UPI00193F9165|nr:competence type IV pilus assembly protein ComGB [Bacillus sp. B15-48]MBM4762278.1 type II secretion system F family protein [Bacillus sp. B15-48]